MASVNKVIVVGNLGRDPELRAFPCDRIETSVWWNPAGQCARAVVSPLAVRQSAAARSQRRREPLRRGWAGLPSLASSFFSNRKSDLRNAP